MSCRTMPVDASAAAIVGPSAEDSAQPSVRLLKPITGAGAGGWCTRCMTSIAAAETAIGSPTSITARWLGSAPGGASWSTTTMEQPVRALISLCGLPPAPFIWSRMCLPTRMSCRTLPGTASKASILSA
eukprot:5157940-Prymnesium_polylepis.1